MSKKSRRRTDFWDDPKAPAPTSRKPSASVVLRNHRGDLLMLHRAGFWAVDHPDRRAEEEGDHDRVRGQ